MKLQDILKKTTIRKRFSIYVLAIVVIIVPFYGFSRAILTKSAIENEISAKSISVTEFAAKSITEAVWNFDFAIITNICNALLQDKEIVYIIIKTGDNEILFEQSNNLYNNKDNLIINTMNLVRDKLKIGTITIGVTPHFRLVTLRNEFISILVSFIILTVILWFAITYVSGIVTKSIYDLIKATEEIKNGNFENKIRIDSGDEVGELADKFNIMVEYIHKMILERDAAINSLTSSEEKFNKAFRYCADVIGIIRLSDKKYIEINDAFTNILGYTRDEILYHSSDEFNLWVNPDERRHAYELIGKYGGFRKYEAIWETKSHDIRYGVTSSEKIVISGESCIVFVWSDLTEMKHAEEVLKRSHEELEKIVMDRTEQLTATVRVVEKQNELMKNTQLQLIQSEKMAGLGTLVAGVAHEMNNPINYLSISSKILEKKLALFRTELMYLISDNEEEIVLHFENIFNEFSDSLKNILEGSNRIKNIIEDLRVFSRLDEAARKEVSIIDAVNSTLRIVKMQFSKNIRFIFNYDKDILIECFPSQLNQVFLNILLNSCYAIVTKIEFGNHELKGIIEISIFENGDEILIKISDNGCGMTEATKLKMFEPFFTTKPIGHGTGLGMSISYSIIETHKGKIEVESEAGKGTIVYIFLPRKIN